MLNGITDNIYALIRSLNEKCGVFFNVNFELDTRSFTSQGLFEVFITFIERKDGACLVVLVDNRNKQSWVIQNKRQI